MLHFNSHKSNLYYWILFISKEQRSKCIKMNRQINRHLKLKKLLLNTLVIVAFVATSIGTSPVAAATTGSKTFFLKASNGRSATFGAGRITTPKKEKLRKSPKKGGKVGSRTFVLGASDGTMTDAKNVDAAPTSGNRGYVSVHYLDRLGNQIAPYKTLQGKIGQSYISSAQDIPGYTLSNHPENATGIFSANQQSVNYIYNYTDNKASLGTKKAGAGVRVASSNTTNHNSRNSKSSMQSSVNYGSLPHTGINKPVQVAILGTGFLSIFGGLMGMHSGRKGTS